MTVIPHDFTKQFESRRLSLYSGTNTSSNKRKSVFIADDPDGSIGKKFFEQSKITEYDVSDGYGDFNSSVLTTGGFELPFSSKFNTPETDTPVLNRICYPNHGQEWSDGFLLVYDPDPGDEFPFTQSIIVFKNSPDRFYIRSFYKIRPTDYRTMPIGFNDSTSYDESADKYLTKKDSLLLILRITDSRFFTKEDIVEHENDYINQTPFNDLYARDNSGSRQKLITFDDNKRARKVKWAPDLRLTDGIRTSNFGDISNFVFGYYGEKFPSYCRTFNIVRDRNFIHLGYYFVAGEFNSDFIDRVSTSDGARQFLEQYRCRINGFNRSDGLLTLDTEYVTTSDIATDFRGSNFRPVSTGISTTFNTLIGNNYNYFADETVTFDSDLLKNASFVGCDVVDRMFDGAYFSFWMEDYEEASGERSSWDSLSWDVFNLEMPPFDYMYIDLPSVTRVIDNKRFTRITLQKGPAGLFPRNIPVSSYDWNSTNPIFTWHDAGENYTVAGYDFWDSVGSSSMYSSECRPNSFTPIGNYKADVSSIDYYGSTSGNRLVFTIDTTIVPYGSTPTQSDNENHRVIAYRVPGSHRFHVHNASCW